jgi:hypothetical protein
MTTNRPSIVSHHLRILGIPVDRQPTGSWASQALMLESTLNRPGEPRSCPRGCRWLYRTVDVLRRVGPGTSRTQCERTATHGPLQHRLSVAVLAEEIGVDPKTVKQWIT